MNRGSFKCHFCRVCDGHGCISELPGMGGVYQNANFIANYEAWRSQAILDAAAEAGAELTDPVLPRLRIAPMTGGIENVGYKDEEIFYRDLIEAAHAAGFALSLGDGTPDIKLQSGIAAVEALRYKSPHARAAVFIKPYPDSVIIDRFRWTEDIAEFTGIDIDAYNIATMRHLVQLEQKTADQLKELKRYARTPFAVKGVFSPKDIELMREVLPDIIVVSNHGGRVESGRGSTADFLARHYKELRSYCGQLWVDGGLRTAEDIKTASLFGVSQVLIGRPVLTALCAGGTPAVKSLYRKLRPPT